MLSFIRRHQLIRPGDRVGVAVSGGADSVALLRLLLEARAELGIVLSVIHFNHKIRGAEADADEQFVRELARGFDLEFYRDAADTPAYAVAHKLSLEAAGRKLRYSYFDRLTGEGVVHRIATAHTRDDQAETVMMRVLRGSGTRGLAGIYPGIGGWFAGVSNNKMPDVHPGPRIIRPVLDKARGELRAYLRSQGQSWREDSSNADTGFRRNRLRHEIMPVLRQLNPNLDHVLAEMAEIAREEESWWETQASVAQEGLWVPPAGQSSLEPPLSIKMRVDVLRSRPLAVQRRLVRTLLQAQGVQVGLDHVDAVLALAAAKPGRARKTVELPKEWLAARQGNELWIERCCHTQQQQDYELQLSIPGDVEVAGHRIRARLVTAGESGLATPRDSHSVLLQSTVASAGLVLRNWRAGDRYWPEHTKEPKKLKELLQARHIPRELKFAWPVVVWGEQIIWVPRFPSPEQFRARESDSQALLLEEVPLEPEG